MNPAINNFNLKELKGRDARLFQEVAVLQP